MELTKKNKDVLDKIVSVLSRWEGTDTIALMHNDYDRYNPYFFLSLDVYNTGPIPDVSVREEDFSFVGVFETLIQKDRFLLNDVPVRLEYKSIKRFNDIIDHSLNNPSSMRDSGTYMFHRIMEAMVIYSRSSWLEESRSRLLSFEDSFWEGLRRNAQARMEHCLGDLSAAAIMEDELFFMISASGFMTSMCRTLFALNHEFEPPPRQLYQRTLALERKPDAFHGLLESFIRHEDTSFVRKKEIAELLVKHIIHL